MNFYVNAARTFAAILVVGVAATSHAQGLVLLADRSTGTLSIRNTTASGVAIDGYSIGSPNGFLNPGNGAWTSFTDATIAGWSEANPTTQRLSELNPTGSRTIAARQTLSLGNSYNFAPTSSGDNFQNLTFQYGTPTGGLFSGAVQYSGPNNNLVLLVDRNTGSVAIQNQSSLTINIDGYSISSPDPFFNSADGSWSSLTDQGNVGWQEANPIPQRLNELNPTASLSFASGQTRSLGTPYTFAPAAFGSNLTNLSFEYSTPTGQRLPGVVQYSGDHNTLVLKVNLTTGQALIENQSSFTVDMDGYSITSLSESLTPATWNSLDDQNVGAWEEANPDTSRISELSPTNSTTLTNSQTLSLGNLLNTSGLRDLVFEFTLSNGSRWTGVVEYIVAGSNGDFDGDGDVDGRDFLVWQRGSSPDPLSGSDLAVWKSNYGAGSLIDISAVPEPSSIALVVAAVFAVASRRQLSAKM